MKKIWHGIFWKMLSCGCFAGINVLVRFLSGGSPLHISNPMPIHSIMFYQHLIGAMVISYWMWHANEFHIKDFITTKPWLHFIRIITAAIGIGLFYLSLRYLPVPQAVALSIAAPIITTIGAVFFLKESFNFKRKLAVIFSVAGGCLIARPDQTLLNNTSYNWYMFLPILAAFAFSLDKLLTRKLLSCNEQPRTLALYLLVCISPLCLLPTIYYGWVHPSLNQIHWILILGFLSAFAHYAFNKAYALAEVTILLPFGAARIILGSIISYMAFYELPKTLDMWLGIAVIIFSTIILCINDKAIIKMRNSFKLSSQET